MAASTEQFPYEVADMTLAGLGDQKIAWAYAHMPLLQCIAEEFEAQKPFAGLRIAISIHLEAKTANLAHVLRKGGAEVWCTGCNPLSTQDAIAASLARAGFAVHARRGVNEAEYEDHLLKTLACAPHLILDDGGDLLGLLSTKAKDLAQNIIGGTEETTTGVHRLRQLSAKSGLPFPMVAVNDAACKHLFDNRYGTGQSVWDAIMRNTNLLIAGKTAVIAGYGWCGRGIAARAQGLGARVIITETDPVHALEAALDGYSIMPMDQAAALGDIFVTATGCRDIIVERHFAVMKDGALLVNAGHFDLEISKIDLAASSTETFEQRADVMGYRLIDGRILNLMAEGRLVNIAAGDGHPIEIMDMSFAVQALTLAHLAKEGWGLSPTVYGVPKAIDDRVATMKVESLGMAMDRMTQAQKNYLGLED